MVQSELKKSRREVKRDRFVRIIERRVNQILDNLDNLGKCSNRRNYIYYPDDVTKLFREIDRKVKETKRLFHGTSNNKKRFQL